MTRGVAVVGVGILVAAGALATWSWREAESESPAYRVIHAERGLLTVTILASGVAKPQNRLEIKPPIAGRIEDVLVREGDRVKKGQVVAWMSSSERAALLDAARAKGADELARWQELYKATPLLAPLPGTVIARQVEPGQTVTAADSVFVLSDRLIVSAQVDETDIGQVRLGQPAEIVLDAYPDTTIGARVDHVAYEAITVSNVTVYEVDVLPERVPDFMRSGMTANVTFVVARHEGVVLLPAEAVRREAGGPVVLVPGPGGLGDPEERAVETGAGDGRQVEIVSGLGEGDVVLVPDLSLPQGASGGGSPFFPFGRTRPTPSGTSK